MSSVTKKVDISKELGYSGTGYIIMARGSKHDFQLFKDRQTAINRQISCLADSGHQGGANLPAESWRPKKKSKPPPLSRPEKMTPQHSAGGRIQIDPVIGKLKVCAIRCRRYSKRRRRL